MFVKFFVGVLGEVRHAGLVLVHDRSGFYKILIFVLASSGSVVVLLIITGESVGKSVTLESVLTLMSFLTLYCPMMS